MLATCQSNPGRSLSFNSCDQHTQSRTHFNSNDDTLPAVAIRKTSLQSIVGAMGLCADWLAVLPRSLVLERLDCPGQSPPACLDRPFSGRPACRGRALCHRCDHQGPLRACQTDHDSKSDVHITRQHAIRRRLVLSFGRSLSAHHRTRFCKTNAPLRAEETRDSVVGVV